MTKLFTPLMSLGATGSIGKSVSLRETRHRHIMEKRPHPANPKTLAQTYQRWLYQDYVYLWMQQTEAVKRQYSSQGVRFHLTGFQYWMKVYLATMPDIAGWWHMDDSTGSLVHDSSVNGNHGTPFGSNSLQGNIGSALHFNGTSDYVMIGAPPALQITSAITIEIFDRPSTQAGYRVFIDKGGAGPNVGYCIGKNPSGQLFIGLGTTVTGWVYFLGSVVLTDGRYHHLGITYNGATIKFYRDGQVVKTAAATGDIAAGPYNLVLGADSNHTLFSLNDLDEVIIRNRALNDVEMLRHALRHYP